MTETGVVRLELTVRFCETDLMGIVHHSNYLHYFEAGRVAWLRARGADFSRWEGLQLPVVDARLRYRKPARFDERIVVETWVADLKGASVRFAYRVVRPGPGGDELLCEGETLLACVGPDMSPRRFSPMLRALLEPAPPPALPPAPLPSSEPPAPLVGASEGRSLQGDVALASDPNAAPEQLTPLYRSPEMAVREALAANPSTPWELLGKLARDFPEVVARNPSVDLQLLADPQALHRWSVRSQEELACCPTGTMRLGIALAHSPFPEVRQMLARNPSTPVEVHRHLLENPGDLTTLLQLAENQAASPNILAALLAHPESKVRVTALKNPSTPRDLVELFERAGAPCCLIEPIDNDLPKGPVSEDELTRLSGLGDWGRIVAAWHPASRRELRLRLASDPSPRVRLQFAVSRASPARLLVPLLADPDGSVATAAASNPSLTREVLDEVAPMQSPRVRRAAALHPQASEWLLGELAQDPEVEVRAAAARSPRLPPRWLERLARDEAVQVREAVAANPSAPLGLLEALAADLNEAVRRTANRTAAAPLPSSRVR